MGHFIIQKSLMIKHKFMSNLKIILVLFEFDSGVVMQPAKLKKKITKMHGGILRDSECTGFAHDAEKP